MRRPVLPHHLRRVALGVRGDGDELHQLAHRRLVDHLLDLGDALGVQRTDVRAVCIDEVQDHDLAAEVFEADRSAFGVLECEVGRFLADRLEVLLAVAKLRFELIERMCCNS